MYYRKTAPRQQAKFNRKSLLLNYAVLPIFRGVYCFPRRVWQVGPARGKEGMGNRWDIIFHASGGEYRGLFVTDYSSASFL